jgi:hypothetical protein
MWDTTIHNKPKDINKKQTLLQTAADTDEPNIVCFRKTQRTLQHILIIYQGLYYCLRVDILSPHGVICQLVSAASAPTSFIRSLQFLNNVIIINSKVNLSQLLVILADFVYPV